MRCQISATTMRDAGWKIQRAMAAVSKDAAAVE